MNILFQNNCKSRYFLLHLKNQNGHIIFKTFGNLSFFLKYTSYGEQICVVNPFPAFQCNKLNLNQIFDKERLGKKMFFDEFLKNYFEKIR